MTISFMHPLLAPVCLAAVTFTFLYVPEVTCTRGLISHRPSFGSSCISFNSIEQNTMGTGFESRTRPSECQWSKAGEKARQSTLFSAPIGDHDRSCHVMAVLVVKLGLPLRVIMNVINCPNTASRASNAWIGIRVTCDHGCGWVTRLSVVTRKAYARVETASIFSHILITTRLPL